MAARRLLRSIGESRLGDRAAPLALRVMAWLARRRARRLERCAAAQRPGAAPPLAGHELVADLGLAGGARPAGTPPDVSLVLLGADRAAIRSLLERGWGAAEGVRVEVLDVACRTRVRLGAGVTPGGPAVPMLVDGLGYARAANLGAGRASGETIVVVAEPHRAAPGEWLRPLVERLRDEPTLGAAAAPASGIAVRAELWRALQGLEEAFATRVHAVADLCLRARALGYRALAAPASAALLARARRRRPVLDLDPAPGATGPRSSALHEVTDPYLFRRRWMWTGELGRLVRRETAWAEAARGPRPERAQVEPAPVERASPVVYTAITEGRDALKPVRPAARGGADLVAFLDAASARLHAGRSRGWRIQPLVPADPDPVRSAKVYKVVPHRFFPDARYSLWVDASITITSPFPLERLIELYLADTDLCVFRHPERRCIYDEARVCARLGADSSAVIARQVRRYRREGYPRGAGLVEASVLLRRHSPEVEAFNEAWWEEIRRGSRRDQLSFNYVARKLGLRFGVFPLCLGAGTYDVGFRKQNGLFVRLAHATPGHLRSG